jgi:uncharacterized protein (UPF0261 family)
MRFNRQQFDIAVGGSYVTSIVTAAFISLPLVVPVTVIGALLTGIAFALRDGAEATGNGGCSHGR